MTDKIENEEVYKIKNSLLRKFSANDKKFSVLLVCFLISIFIFYFPFLLFFIITLLITLGLVSTMWAIVLTPMYIVIGIIKGIKDRTK